MYTKRPSSVLALAKLLERRSTSRLGDCDVISVTFYWGQRSYDGGRLRNLRKPFPNHD